MAIRGGNHREPGARRGGARRTRGARPTAVRAEINVTPLVDVVLVLLIIFMVVTPMLSKGINVDLPVTQHHEKRGDDNRDIVVAITRTGDVYVGSDRVPVEGVEEAVAAQRRRYPEKTLFLKGDSAVDFGRARRVMEALHRAGADQLQLGTEELREGGKP